MGEVGSSNELEIKAKSYSSRSSLQRQWRFSLMKNIVTGGENELSKMIKTVTKWNKSGFVTNWRMHNPCFMKLLVRMIGKMCQINCRYVACSQLHLDKYQFKQAEHDGLLMIYFIQNKEECWKGSFHAKRTFFWMPHDLSWEFNFFYSFLKWHDLHEMSFDVTWFSIYFKGGPAPQETPSASSLSFHSGTNFYIYLSQKFESDTSSC